MKARFTRSFQHAPDVITYYFQPEHRLRYEAGQFIELHAPHNADARGERRWFTISTAPTESEIGITTRIAQPGSTYKRALQGLVAGDTVSISQAMGDFVLPRDITLPLVFIAAGIGITPYCSMIKYLADTAGVRDIKMLITSKSGDILPFKELLEDYLGHNLVFSSHRTSASEILTLYPPTEKTMYYLAGPEAFISELVRDLQQSGVPSHQIVADYFHNYHG